MENGLKGTGRKYTEQIGKSLVSLVSSEDLPFLFKYNELEASTDKGFWIGCVIHIFAYTSWHTVVVCPVQRSDPNPQQRLSRAVEYYNNSNNTLL